MSKAKRLYSKLRAKVVEEGHTQADLADMLGLTPQAVNAKFQGRTDFTLREIVKICNFLNADPVIFFEPELHDLQFLQVTRAQ